MTQRKYVPVLKGKLGEFGALRNMRPDEKCFVTPLIEIPPIPWDHANDQPAKSVDQHLSKVDGLLAKSWGMYHPMFLDFLWIGEKERMSDGAHPMENLFERTRKGGLKVIPVTALVRGEDYQRACRRIAARDHRGMCFRIQTEDFEQPELESKLAEILKCVGVSVGEVDLLLDLGSLDSGVSTQTVTDVVSMIRNLPYLSKWRSFAISATGFPVDLMGLPPLNISTVSRLEWRLWRNIIKTSIVPRMPVFGDYAIAHPQPPEVDPRIMRASASIRYTTDDDWLILKGQNLRDHGYGQFHDLSDTLVSSGEYSGPEFSWGDWFIGECAGRRSSSGNLTTWRAVGTSHHISFVLLQVANFS
jgi:hypothetical protein